METTFLFLTNLCRTIGLWQAKPSQLHVNHQTSACQIIGVAIGADHWTLALESHHTLDAYKTLEVL